MTKMHEWRESLAELACSWFGNAWILWTSGVLSLVAWDILHRPQPHPFLARLVAYCTFGIAGFGVLFVGLIVYWKLSRKFNHANSNTSRV